jgi:hypothetical protein
MRWLFPGKGMLTYSPSIVDASVKVLPGYGDSLLIRPPWDELHVHGLDGLRVVDASVMPGPTPNPSIMIARRVRRWSRRRGKNWRRTLGAALPGRCQVIGKRRRRTRVRSATTMLRVISSWPMT